MKIYFTASLRGKKEFGKNYISIVNSLTKQGNKVFSDHIIKFEPESLGVQSKEEAKKNYDRILSSIKKSDVFVAEVSTQSLSVGHEVTEAMALNKPMIILYSGDNRPGLLFGSVYDKMQIIQYTVDSKLDEVLSKAVDDAMRHADVRFNFFVSPKILAYLDWVAQKRMIPRSVYLRNLIEKEMRKNKEFNG
ncbi:MAG: hypothetical protein WC851_01465 [Candidatus Shapirobacteria bacterium]|jgi:hypothetical protein